MREEWIVGVSEGREPWLQRKERQSGAHRDVHRENMAPTFPLARKMRGADFHESLQRVGLKDWSFRGQKAWLGWNPEGAALLHERKHKQPQDRQPDLRIT